MLNVPCPLRKDNVPYKTDFFDDISLNKRERLFFVYSCLEANKSKYRTEKDYFRKKYDFLTGPIKTGSLVYKRWFFNENFYTLQMEKF